MSDISLNDAKNAMREIIEDYHLVKKLKEQGDTDLAYAYICEEETVTHPETGKEHYFNGGGEIEILNQIILSLGGGGPELRAVLSVDKDGDIREFSLQHRGYNEKWEMYRLQNAVEEDALAWFLTDALNLQELYMER